MLLALRSQPLDLYWFTVDLATTRFIVSAELDGLIEAGLVHGVTVESGRQASRLTIRGRSRISEADS